MNTINYISQIILPIIFVITIACGYCSGTDIYSAFTKGAAEGLKTVVSVLPSLTGLMIAVGIFRASGAMDLFISLFKPVSACTGFPEKLISLGIVKMFSSSAATGLLIDIFKTEGVDSLCAMAASVMMSCTETIFYTLSIYSAAGGIKKTRYTVACAVISNISGIIASYVISMYFFCK